MQANAAFDVSAQSDAIPAAAAVEKPAGAVVDASALFGVHPVALHVRFSPDANISHIDERPADLDKLERFARLCAKVGDKYQARPGDRGLFSPVPLRAGGAEGAACELTPAARDEEPAA